MLRIIHGEKGVTGAVEETPVAPLGRSFTLICLKSGVFQPTVELCPAFPTQVVVLVRGDRRPGDAGEPGELTQEVCFAPRRIRGTGPGIIVQSYFAIKFRQRATLDESLDVWACHGMGGLWGALATGFFATTTVNSAGADGLLYGNPRQLLIQAGAALVVIVYATAVTWLLAKGLQAMLGLRVTPNEEEVGLDISEHGERAYS